MPRGIVMYLEKADFDLILDRLNGDDEIAFFVSDGPARWKAVKTVTSMENTRHSLWHVPSGRLPLCKALRKKKRFWHRSLNQRPGWIRNPWAGWDELRTPMDTRVPYFGPGWPGQIDLDVAVRSGEGWIDMSAFTWIGRHYSSIGVKPKPQTEEWWERLRKWVQQNAKAITCEGPLNGRPRDVWAFPGALKAIKAGTPRKPV